MSRVFTVSPDFSPNYLPGWFLFNTWLQRMLDVPIHFEPMEDFDSLHQAIDGDAIDLIYANPYDAAKLVREKGFRALVKPAGESDEVVVAVPGDSAVHKVEAVPAGSRIATSGDPDVHLIGMILLEPAGLGRTQVHLQYCDNYVLVAKQLLQGRSDVGIFLAKAFDELSRPVKQQLRVLVRSDIQVIHHCFMLGPRMKEYLDGLKQALVHMERDSKGRAILSSLGLPGWEAVDEEEVEFMIDLMDTLTYSPA